MKLRSEFRDKNLGHKVQWSPLTARALTGLMVGVTLFFGCGSQSTGFYGSSETVAEPPPTVGVPPQAAEALPELPVAPPEATEPDRPTISPPSPAAPPIKEPDVKLPPPPPAPPKEPDLEVKKPLRKLTWLWQCDGKALPPPTSPVPPGKVPEDDSSVINGPGQHVLDRDVSQGTFVTLAGDLCAPEIQPRDLLFVIDTSISMEDNDPLVGTTCGRLNGMETIIKSLSVGDNQMGIVTFSSNVNVFSPQFFKKQTDLFAALAPAGNIAEVICDDSGTTNYQSGIVKAGELMALGRPQATKELFLISDGEPNNGEDGVTEATALKTTGVAIGGKNYPVTIATIMLNGTDTVMEQFIASKDAAGKPMHVFANQSSQLAKALADLAENPIVSATMKYRSKGQANFTEVNLVTSADKKTFQLPPVSFTYQAMKDGIEVIYKYTNKRGQTSEYSGNLTISPVPAPKPTKP